MGKKAQLFRTTAYLLLSLLFVVLTIVSSSIGIDAAPSASGNVWSIGNGDYGQLGNGQWHATSLPVEVSNLENVVAIAAGHSYALAIKSDGTVWAWGYNWYGQLGNGTRANSDTPTQVIGLAGIVAVSSGGDTSYALDSYGAVWAWGCNTSGQLGNGVISGPNDYNPIPILVSGINGVTAIAGGRGYCLALKLSGTVWGWGSDACGILNGTGNHTYPIQIVGLTGIIAISASSAALALKSDGTVFAWGRNYEGQLGNGTTSGYNSNPTPTRVLGIGGVVAIAEAPGFSLALKSDGTVWGWGNNSFAQLGIGTLNDSYVPTQVYGLTGAISIAANGSYGLDGFSLALKSDGTVWSWGADDQGQLGRTPDGWYRGMVPGQVNGVYDVSAIAAGYQNTFAISNLSGYSDIGVSANSMEISCGDSTPSASDGTDFGGALIGSSVFSTFTIHNTGTAPLVLTNNPLVFVDTVGGVGNPGDFNISAQPGLEIRPGASTTFTVRFIPSGAGLRSIWIVIRSNDNIKNPFTFEVKGFGLTAGSITGFVLGQGGQPINGARVQAYEYSNYGVAIGQATTDATGYYVLIGLPNGTYRVNASASGWISKYWPDTPLLQYAAPVAVASPSITTGINFTLDHGGTFSGTVKNATGQPLPNVSVGFSLEGTGNSWVVLTNSSGGFTSMPLPFGGYRISAPFSTRGGSGDGNYVTQYFYNRPDSANADVMYLSASTTNMAGLQLVLSVGGNISGTVLDQQGQPLSGVTISAMASEDPGAFTSRAVSGANGAYTILGIPTGSYLVKATASSKVAQYYQGASTANNATRVAVTAPANSSGINFSLEPGGRISGIVTDSISGMPISGISVQFSNLTTGLSTTTATTSSGTYSSVNLPYGQYKVNAPSFAKSGSGDDGYATQYYNNKPNAVGADIVTLSASNTSVTGINFSISHLSVPVGVNIPVSDLASSTTAQFDNVTTPGTMTVTQSNTGPVPNTNFIFLGSYYDITTTASFSGFVTITLHYEHSQIPSGVNEAQLKLFHYEGAKWVNVTIALDTVNNLISGRVSSLSPFAVGVSDSYTLEYLAGAHGSVVGANQQTVNYGGSGTLVAATPDNGYHFVSWSDGILSAARTDTNVTANISVTAIFAINFNPTISIKGGSFTYDGTSHEAVVSVTGQDGAPVAGTLSVIYNGSTALPVKASIYTIQVAFTSNDPCYNSATGQGSLTITKKVASVTPAHASKLFGSADPALSGTLIGFLPSDNVAATYSRQPGEAVGTYTISATLSPAGALANYNVTHNTALFTIIGPKGLKTDTLAILSPYLQSTDKSFATKIQQAIDHIRSSLDAKLWLDAVTIQKAGGERVFNEEKDAVVKLMELQKDKATTAAVRADLQRAIDNLVNGDRILAQTAILTSSSKELDKAQQEMTQAADDFATGDWINVIEHYKNAWLHAVKTS